MTMRVGMERFRSALSHWGPVEYFALAMIWLVLSSPLYLWGLGVASLLSLPLVLILISAVALLVPYFFKSATPSVAEPRPGFPREIGHPQLGEFTLSRHSDRRYERVVSWRGTPVQLSLLVETFEAITTVLLVATRLMQKDVELDETARDLVANELLSSINVERLAAGANALDVASFQQVISLKGITLHEDGSYDFMYEDGELLGGHWIQVNGSLEHGPTEVDVVG